MTPIEKAQMYHLRARWHRHADRLLEDETLPGGWYMADLCDLYAAAPQTIYRPDGQRRRLDS